MNQNLHGYPYKIGDIGWVITENLTFRSGVCSVVNGIISGQYSYIFTMDDNNQPETYNQTQLYPTLGSAQIKAQTLVTPTPSVSHSVTPTPSRTPFISPTATLTPTPSPVIYPNLLQGVTWTPTNGTVTIDGHGNTVFTSTATASNQTVSFLTSISVTELTQYLTYIRFLEGTCQYATLTIDAISTTQMVRLLTTNSDEIISSNNFNHSGVLNTILNIPAGYSSLNLTISLYGDSNYKNAVLSGFTFRFGITNLQKYVPYVAPSPTPSSGMLNAYDSAILADSPIAYWSLNTNLKDMVNNDTLTLYTDVALAPDSFGNTLAFSKTHSTSYAPNTASFVSGVATEYTYPLSNNYSLELWFNLASTSVSTNALISTIATYSYTDLLLLSENGVVDTTYTNLGLNGQVNCILQIADGHIYIGGTFTQVGVHNYGGLARLTSAGVLDTTFVDLNANSNGNGITALYQTSDGHIYVGGDFTTIGGQSYNSLARLTSTGILDTTFTDLAMSGSGVTFLTQTADTHIYVIGNFNQWGAINNYLIGRLNSDGTIDSSFNSSAIGINGLPSLIYQTLDGKIYMGGQFTGSLLRLNSDGTLDTTFTSLNIDNMVYDIIQTADSKIYLVGPFTTVGGSTYSAVARLNSNGTLDTTFTAIGDDNSYLTSSIVQVPNGDIYIGGSFYSYLTKYTNLVRLTSTGTIDSSFTPLPYINFSTTNIASINGGNDLVLYGNGTYKDSALGLSYYNNTFYIHGANEYIVFQANINYGQTYHIVLSVNNNVATLYVDGTPYSPVFNRHGTSPEIYNYNAIGIDNNANLFLGDIGNIAFYNSALNQTQITNHYNAGKTGYRYNVTPVTPTPSPTVTLTPSITPTPSG